MKALRFPILALACALCGAGGRAAHVPAPVDLKCEHLRSPLGIDNPTPRLSWRLDDPRQGARQTALRVIVGRDSTEVAGGVGRMWDTGVRPGAEILVTYGGEPLEPHTRYFWRVSAWDAQNVERRSPVEGFETGMICADNWHGSWIGDGRGIEHKPAPYFRREFTAEKPIRSARAYIAAGGLFELQINGRKAGDNLLDPMYTRFDRRVLYVTHDVTALLRGGQNAIGVILGNGWYNHQSIAVWDFDKAPWRNRPTFCLDLRVTYQDGTTQVISTDLEWKTSSGPIALNSIYTGEHYDARLERRGWSEPGFDSSAWQGVRYRSAPSGNIVSQQLHPVRSVERFRAVSVRRLSDTSWLYDFGVNMSGVTRLNVRGREGTRLKLIHAERLTPDGHADQSNIDVYYRGDRDADPFQTDIVILSGGDDHFTPRFNYKGFRYVEVVSDSPIELREENLTAHFVHSDVPPAGRVSSSHPVIDKLWAATNRAYLSNLMGYPTDCPQREKNGWTGDGHLAIQTALYNFDGITVYEKWLADHRDEQQPNGVLPDIIPTGGWGYGTDNGLDWTSTIAIIPWELYLFYGDDKPLRDNYPNMKRYVDYVDRSSPDGLTTWGRGDWVPVKTRSDKRFTSSVYFYVDACIVSRAAGVLGMEGDRKRYSALAEKIRAAINENYLDREAGVYASGSQTEMSMALLWGIAPDGAREKVAANLAERVRRADYHLDTGVLGARAILDALADNGYPDVAYRVAVQDTYPSWGWWVVNGATTLLENWDLEATRDISDNHMMFGHIGGWLFRGLGGIRPDPSRPGFGNTILRPWFPPGLDRFQASHDSPYGRIVSGWEREGGARVYTAVVPANSTATLHLPTAEGGERVLRLEAGTHRFVLDGER